MSLTVEDPKKRRSILVGVCVALMAVIASVSGLNVAQPQIATTFNASQGEVLWMINLYAITLAALLLPLGALGDRWGRKPVMVVGLLVFGFASALAGLAPSAEVLLVARFLSGVGAALVMPVTLSTITSTFPEGERSRAVGVWTAVAGGGGLLGMFLSALLVDVLSWRWLFVLPVVLVGVSLAITLRSVPNSREASEHRFDSVGALLSIVAVVGLIVALHEGPLHGWMDPLVLVSLAVGVATTLGFVAWEWKHRSPLLDLRHFRQRSLTSGSLVILIWFGVQAGVFIVLFPFFQTVLGWSGLQATLGMMPMAFLMMAASAVAPRISARAGSRTTMVAGLVLGASGLLLMAAFVSISGGFLSLLPGMIAMGFGMGLSLTPSTEAITSSLPADRQGVASALNDVTRELGTALGVALLGAVFTSGYGAAIAGKLAGDTSTVAAAARLGIANALEAQKADSSLVEQTLQAARESFLLGWQQAMYVGAVLLVVLLVYVLVLGPRGKRV